MSLISPSVLASNIEDYQAQLAAILPVVTRVHIDLGDGEFTSRTVSVNEVTWPAGVIADIHLMYQDPIAALDEIIALRPNLVTVHTEAHDVVETIERLQLSGIKAGVALTQPTTVESVAHIVALVDHVLIFSGSLGHFGGVADLGLLHKVEEIRLINPAVEIGWDGGASLDNVAQLSKGGVDVIVAGGAIQRADSPIQAYAQLEAALIA